MKCPGKGLERILPLLGPGFEDAVLELYKYPAAERLFYSAIKGTFNIDTFEDDLMEHINGCRDCQRVYYDYVLKEYFPDY